jgi:hypothetical protein
MAGRVRCLVTECKEGRAGRPALVGRVFIAPDKGTKGPLGRSQSTRRSG